MRKLHLVLILILVNIVNTYPSASSENQRVGSLNALAEKLLPAPKPEQYKKANQATEKLFADPEKIWKSEDEQGVLPVSSTSSWSLSLKNSGNKETTLLLNKVMQAELDQQRESIKVVDRHTNGTLHTFVVDKSWGYFPQCTFVKMQFSPNNDMLLTTQDTWDFYDDERSRTTSIWHLKTGKLLHTHASRLYPSLGDNSV